ncbi:MAG TPA: formylglycine-generating enzyme family protein [Nitrosomonas nitrosa]|nr:formylglycine-generating enzyme family protein [Nitrosomonas nitrosa]
MLPGFWFYLPASAETLKPDWAVDAGRDQYGLYADARIEDVIQRFRWIEPTSFMMGSPEEEAGRFDNEMQHRVILTQGYWLADTACTQVLWKVIMHGNLSYSEGASKPVDNISWQEALIFLERLNSRYPVLSLRLPTENEWEHACRAGTISAFNFGDEIVLDKVNYRGTWGDQVTWREGALKQTVEVKSYPPNAWGLYEMHGNVWEWCQDWDGDYPTGAVTFLQDSNIGTYRVLRGGSWIDGGKHCRSARRNDQIQPERNLYGPSGTYYNLGFRLARGHELKPVRTVRAGQQPAGSRAGGAHGRQAGDGLRGGENPTTKR